MDGIFRKRNIDKVTSPEKLDDYIRVTTPGVWIVLIAIIILLVGTIVWSALGEITIHNPDGTTETVSPITYIIN